MLQFIMIFHRYDGVRRVPPGFMTRLADQLGYPFVEMLSGRLYISSLCYHISPIKRTASFVMRMPRYYAFRMHRVHT